MTTRKGTAQGWIDTDVAAARSAVRRLGLAAAASYEMCLIADRAQQGDETWIHVTYASMRAALRALGRNEREGLDSHLSRSAVRRVRAMRRRRGT